MTLISKETRGSYNTVIANVNQKVSAIVDMVEKLVSTSEINSASLEDSLNTLIKRTNNLKTYVNGLLNINKQMDANMPDDCDYSWVYTDHEYDCLEQVDCGESL